MEYDVYFDESGDLGWTLDQPYRKGGSSRYFTIAYLILPVEKRKHITRFIRKFHKERNGKQKEIKGASFRGSRAKKMARTITNLFEWNHDITIGSITVKKPSVPMRLVNTGNDDVLYNHMVRRGIASKLASFEKVNIIPDKRSVPSGSQNSCSDLLKEELWLNLRSTIEVNYQPDESSHNTKLMFIDWVANFIWRHYEDSKSGAYHILLPFIEEDLLFFEE